MTQQDSRAVVITRPPAQAGELAQRVAALGRRAVVFPLLDIQPLADPRPLRAALADLRAYALVAFVSPNAIDAVFTELGAGGWPAGVPLAVVGEGSRAALARHGLTAANATIHSPRDPQRTDSETLLRTLDLEALRGRKALILRAESGRELLADALRAAGVEVEQVAAYRRLAPTPEPARLQALRQLAASDNDWLLTSSEALRNLLDMARQAGGQPAVSKLQQQHLLVPHQRIRETALALGFQDITLTAAGDEGLLAALQFRR